MANKWLVGAGIFVLGAAVGAVGFVTDLRDVLRREMTCQELQSNPLVGKELTIKGCTLNLATATYFYDEKGHVSELFVPVFAADGLDTTTTKISLRTKDPAMLKAVSDMVDVLKAGKDLASYLNVNADKYRVVGDFAVRVSDQYAQGSASYLKLKGLDRELTPGFMVLETR